MCPSIWGTEKQVSFRAFMKIVIEYLLRRAEFNAEFWRYGSTDKHLKIVNNLFARRCRLSIDLITK